MDDLKIWRSDENGDDRVIAYINQTIYKGNPKPEEIDNCIFELKTLKTPSRNFFSIPLRYISAINMQENKKYIEILFKGDTEQLNIKNDLKRSEIFEYFKQTIPLSGDNVHRYSKLKAGKKPLIAMAVICIIFLWTLYLATGIEAGNEYDVTGQQYHSIAGIVLALASIGVKNVILLFAALFAIASYSFFKKIKHPPVIHQLVVKH